MAMVTGAFLDTTVLLAGLIDMGPPSASSQDIFDAIVAGRVREVHTAWHCCLEFYAVSTRLPEELRLTPSDAVRLLDQEVLARFRVHQIAPGTRRSFLQAAERDRVVGGRIYDAHIAEAARHSGARVVVTDNVRHFAPLQRHGVRVLSSLQFVAEIRS